MCISVGEICLLLLAIPLLTVSAQAQESQLQHGQRIRVRTCNPACSWRHEGILVGKTSDTVAIQTKYAVVKLAQTQVRAIDVEVPNRAFDGTAAIWGAVIGGLTCGAVAQAIGDGTGEQLTLTLPAVSAGAFLGAFAGGLASSRRGARTGLIAGAISGTFTGLAWCGVAEGFLSCAVEEGAGVGALLGAGAGAVIGVVLGALDRHHWQRIPLGHIQVTPVVGTGGRYGIAVSLKM